MKSLNKAVRIYKKRNSENEKATVRSGHAHRATDTSNVYKVNNPPTGRRSQLNT